ncbi:response regulator [bacterium]|nr:response regulator [bacterium]
MNAEPHRVLIVDDEPGFAQMVRLHLEKSGRYQIQTENDPTRSLTTARAFQPELILLEVVMTGMDGGEVLSLLQDDESLRRVPVLFLTATLTEKTVRSHGGVFAGQPVMAKPVNVKKLVRQIEDILNSVRRSEVAR